MFKQILVSFITAVIVVVGVWLVGNQSADVDLLGAIGITRYPNSGIAARSLKVSTSTNPTAAADGTLVVTGGTTLTGETSLGNCGTASYTIPALSKSGDLLNASWATTTVSVTGAALGDVALVSNNSSTNALIQYGVVAKAEISSANTAVVLFSNLKNATSTAVTTSTITVCYFD